MISGRASVEPVQTRPLRLFGSRELAGLGAEDGYIHDDNGRVLPIIRPTLT